ncbi:hypothetical protein Tco_0917005 [Tanacetum coccineum]
MTKSSSTSLNSFLEETNTFDNSLTESESFCFDLEENSSGSTTTRSDYSLPDYEAFNDDHIKEKSSSSTTTHADFSQYDSFIFDLSINPFPPADRSYFYHEEFADSLTSYLHWIVISSASSEVTYTSIYTDSEPGRAFWGADNEEAQRIHKHRQFLQARDPEYVPEPIYHEYIPLEDEHKFPGEEQPLPPIDSSTAESLRYITDLDPKEDPEENEEEHLAPADSAVVVPTDEPISLPEGTKLVIPPPSTDITIGARIIVWS